MYDFDIRGVFRRHGTTSWPLTVDSSRELEVALVEGGHILPLPKEPAALANVLEVSIVDFVLSKIEAQTGAEGRRGTERGYPDIELSGRLFGGGYHAVDVKVAKRAVNKRGVPTKNTQSRLPSIPAGSIRSIPWSASNHASGACGGGGVCRRGTARRGGLPRRAPGFPDGRSPWWNRLNPRLVNQSQDS
jgi:hypothetical protein